MPDPSQCDTPKVWKAVQEIVDRLMELDADDRCRVLRTVETFFNLQGELR